MIDGRRALGVVPARGGSKGIPRKNIRELAGRPLLAWTVGEARRSRFLDRLVLSSEDAEIIRVAQQWGCEAPFVRPAELAGDGTPSADVLLHALSCLPGYDYVVLLQPTSPLRSAEDVDGCLEFCAKRNARSCVSVTEAEPSPYWMFSLDPDARIRPLLENAPLHAPRQALPPVFALNGAVSVAQVAWLLESRVLLDQDTLGYPMPRERSVDVDSELDWLLAEALLRSAPR